MSAPDVRSRRERRQLSPFEELYREVIRNGCQEEGCEEEGHEEEGCEEEEVVTGILDLARPEGRAGSRRPPLVYLPIAFARNLRVRDAHTGSGSGIQSQDEPSSPIRAVRPTKDGWAARSCPRPALPRARVTVRLP